MALKVFIALLIVAATSAASTSTPTLAASTLATTRVAGTPAPTAQACPLVSPYWAPTKCPVPSGACFRAVEIAAMLPSRNSGTYTTVITPLSDASQAISYPQSGATGYIHNVFLLRGGEAYRVDIVPSADAPEIEYYDFMYDTTVDTACNAGVDLVFTNRPGRYHTYFGFGRHQRPKQLPCSNSESTYSASSALYFDRCTGVGQSERVVRLPAGASVTDDNGNDMVMHFDVNLPANMCPGGADSCFTQPYITKPGSWIPTPAQHQQTISAKSREPLEEDVVAVGS